MAEIVLRALGKTYPGGAPAVTGVDLTITDGEFVVLVGPSGCGKSTLLRMIAGLEAVSTGEVLIGGQVVNRLEPAARNIAMVFQNYALYPHMTVRQNLSYGLRNRGMARAEIDTRVAEAARILEISDYLERKPKALSGGQRQRVAMGRAIVRDPAAFLFDEPLSNLDAKLRVAMRGEIRALHRRLGTTSVYVTHDQLEAMTLADRLVVLRQGRIEQVGTPMQVYARPASTFVAEFIGAPAMNLVDGTITDGALRLGDAVVPVDMPPAAPASGAVRVGLRAEDLLPVPAGTPGAIPLRLEYVEDLGATRLIHARLAGQPMVLSRPAAETVAEDFHATIAPDRLHLFDHQTGTRLG